ncbi:hypothetical protein ACYSNV_02580 [Myroides sp. LJL119]
MKIYSFLVSCTRILLCFTLLILFSCTHNDNTIGDRAAQSWENFVQKDLIGTWNPSVIEIKPLIGKPLFTMNYPVIQDCSIDQVTLNRDYSGNFTHFLKGCTTEQIDFTWSHVIMRLRFSLPDGTVITPLLLKKSSNQLELAVPVKTVMPYIKDLYPEIDQLEQDLLDLLVVSLVLVK